MSRGILAKRKPTYAGFLMEHCTPDYYDMTRIISFYGRRSLPLALPLTIASVGRTEEFAWQQTMTLTYCDCSSYKLYLYSILPTRVKWFGYETFW